MNFEFYFRKSNLCSKVFQQIHFVYISNDFKSYFTSDFNTNRFLKVIEFRSCDLELNVRSV